MDKLSSQLNSIAKDELGVEVIDLRVKKIDLPPEVSESVFNRMRTERERLAKELRHKEMRSLKRLERQLIKIKQSF